jgi:ABC-2 type transport system ATP-binding protein
MLPQGVTLSGNNGSSLRFRVERPQETNPILLRQLSEAQAPVVTLHEVPRSLEQVYLKVMADAQSDVEVRQVSVAAT